MDVVVSEFGAAYPELAKARASIHSVIQEEEASFSRTLVKGIERFKKAAAAAAVSARGVWGLPLARAHMCVWTHTYTPPHTHTHVNSAHRHAIFPPGWVKRRRARRAAPSAARRRSCCGTPTASPST